MKRIVVTGAKGGTGSSIVRGLSAAGYDVLGLDLAMPGHREGGYRRADVLDGASLHELFEGADGVVHFGSLPTDNWTSASDCYRNLMLGGYNVFQACAQAGVQRLVHASSMEVYGSLQQQPRLPITEDSPLTTSSIYGTSKVMLERLAADYCRWHGMSIAALRLGRIIYEDSWSWRLQAHTEARERCAECLWCYVDARDVADACHAWLRSDIQGFRPFNVAADDVCIDVPTAELLQEFYPDVTIDRQLGEYECPFVSTALRDTLGWQPRMNWRAIRTEAE
jgi:nucleoside-diphosphate-sugar epimerase